MVYYDTIIMMMGPGNRDLNPGDRATSDLQVQVPRAEVRVRVKFQMMLVPPSGRREGTGIIQGDSQAGPAVRGPTVRSVRVGGPAGPGNVTVPGSESVY